jgi:tRNA A-37 threonylcarbamoyl transferase component Bud32
MSGTEHDRAAAATVTTTLAPAPAGDDPFAPGREIGAYRIERQLGAGGMGVVLLAEHALLRRKAALKAMRPELAADRAWVERFLREARAAAAVSHQGLVAIHDAGESAGRTWLAFEFVSGGDLDARLAADGPLPPRRALAMIAACAEALQALHEAGLVHRDIKPHNIFLDARGRPKLGDFGLARDAGGADRMTMTGTGMGTPAYMAPEQANGDPHIDIRADIHALGGTLYTMLTRRTPFQGATPWAVVNAVLNDPPPDPRQVRPDVPAEVAGIIARAMAKRREDRFPDPAALAAACRAALARLEGGAAAQAAIAAPPTASLLGPFSGSGWLWLAAAAGLLLLLPLALNPLCGIAAAWRGPGYAQPALWGAWLGWSAAAAALLWNPLHAARGERLTRWGLAGSAVLTAAAVAALWWCAWSALLAATEAGRDWQPVAAISTTALALAWAGWWIRRGWSGDAAILAALHVRAVQAAIPLLIAVLAGHLIAAGGDAPAEPAWSNRFTSRGGDEARAAWALAIAAPLCLALATPLLLLLRKRP